MKSNNKQCSVCITIDKSTKYYLQFWAPHFKTNIEKLEKVQSQATKMIQSLEGKS